jgi:hypothetical protein
MAGAKQSFGHVRTHAAETDHPKLHETLLDNSGIIPERLRKSPKFESRTVATNLGDLCNRSGIV